MRNPDIARMLKYYRKINNLSVKTVAADLEERMGNNISTKTIYGWENGISQPSADVLMHLCEIYEINDVLEAFGYENNSQEKRFFDTMTKEEIAILESYRAHPELHDAIKRLLEFE